MKLTIQPGAGIEPVLTAIRKAKVSVHIAIFRLDIKDVVEELSAAVKRGLVVRALVAHTNRGGENTLRKLEVRMLDTGVTVSRSADEFGRYHAKIMIIDGKTLHVQGFNYTKLDVNKSRSFSVATTQRGIVQDALKLFEADLDRQPYSSSSKQLVVSPDNSRARLAAFIKGAKKQLFIYDPDLRDPMMLRLLGERKKAGVEIRIIGKAASTAPVPAQKYPGKRLHVRAIIRDGSQAFIGSQSLRALELDRRREVGILITHKKVVRQMSAVFDEDWAQTQAAAEGKTTSEVVSAP